MKYERLAWALLLLGSVALGDAKLYLTKDCIVGFWVDRHKCIEKGPYAICDGVVIRFDCIKVEAK